MKLQYGNTRQMDSSIEMLRYKVVRQSVAPLGVLSPGLPSLLLLRYNSTISIHSIVFGGRVFDIAGGPSKM